MHWITTMWRMALKSNMISENTQRDFLFPLLHARSLKIAVPHNLKNQQIYMDHKRGENRTNWPLYLKWKEGWWIQKVMSTRSGAHDWNHYDRQGQDRKMWSVIELLEAQCGQSELKISWRLHHEIRAEHKILWVEPLGAWLGFYK